VLAIFVIVVHGGGNPATNSIHCELTATKHLTVFAKINGQGPYRLIFDTGAPVVLLTSKVAREAKIGESTRRAPKDKMNWTGLSVAGSIEIGPSRAEVVPVAILDHPTLKAIEEVIGRVDGIIGYPFFARFKSTIDYANLRMTFEPNGYEPEDVFQSMLSRFRKGAAKAIAPAGQWGLEIDKVDDKPGVNVKTVYVHGAAAVAGVRVGDRILTMDGRWTDSIEDCFRAVSVLPAGQPAPITIRRQNRQLKLQITPRPGF
jgi:hypothetical protein